MSSATATSLTDMKGAFPDAPTPIEGIPTLETIITLIFHMCRCAQTHRSPASDTMNLLFCACPRSIYPFFTADPYPDQRYAPIPQVVPDVPDYTACTNENERATAKAVHAILATTRADIITMNAALVDVFLSLISSGVRASFEQIRLREPNIIFVDMIDWFVEKYGTTTPEDRDANRSRMAADWHPSEGFDALTTRLFKGGAYSNACDYPIPIRDIIDIGIRVIKRCGLYNEEYKQWIARGKSNAAATPAIRETFDSFKTWWADKITLVNQTAIPAGLHGYGMMAADDESVISYEESLANFGAAYAATQESVKSQASTIATLQTQMQSMQQYCMNLQQMQLQPPMQSAYPRQQQRDRRGTNRSGSYRPAARTPAQPPTYANPPSPMKRFENWNYCHTHGGDIDDMHNSMTCAKPGPAHNRNATRQNTMGGSTGGMHKTILPSASGRVPPPPRQVRAPAGPPIVQQMSPTQHAAWRQAGGPPLTQPAMPMYPQAMPMYPQTQGMWHVGQQTGPPPPAMPPVAAAPPPQPGTYMMPPYYQYQQPF